MSGPSADGRVPVHLLELPVPVAARAQEHVEGLLREFTLMQAGAADGHEQDREVPRRLLNLVDTLTQQFAGVNDAPRDRLDAAIARGDAVIADHELELPPEAAPASQALGDLLDQADEYCRQGQHLLTLSTPPDCLTYRRWYLGEVIGQLAGEAPTSWPEFRRRDG